MQVPGWLCYCVCVTLGKLPAISVTAVTEKGPQFYLISDGDSNRMTLPLGYEEL